MYSEVLVLGAPNTVRNCHIKEGRHSENPDSDKEALKKLEFCSTANSSANLQLAASFTPDESWRYFFMQYQIQQIAAITNGTFTNRQSAPALIEHFLLDTRQITFPASSLFVALEGRHFDGHDFLENAYQGGVRNFLVSKKINAAGFPSANFILVKNTLSAFQQIAIHHRRQFDFPVVGITGSNGKTVVKEWLFQLLHKDYHIVRSPKSYNSQTGVPLSVFQMAEAHNFGIFEAGISQMGEMGKLAPIIAPDIGIFTTLGEAHSEGFPDKATKLQEKLKLFKNAKTLIYCCDNDLVEKEIADWKIKNNNAIKLIKWSATGKPASFEIKKINSNNSISEIKIAAHQLPIKIPFTDDASIENAVHCYVLMKYLKYSDNDISKKMSQLEPVAMRLELKAGNDGCVIINDSYNSDLSSLKIALDFLIQQSKTPRRTLILSDILQSGQPNKKLYTTVAELIVEKSIDRVIGIGADVVILNKILPNNFEKTFFENTDLFLKNIDIKTFHNETILLKGARQFYFEKIANRLSRKTHQTVLEVNLTALLNNLRTYQKHIQPGTKLMVMVKASAYGSGSVETAKLLDFQQVDYLTVAYADEGVELRKAGIQLPILVLNPEEATFDRLLEFGLEPEIYNFYILKKYLHFLQSFSEKKQQPIHIKLDTGMHRLGFEKNDILQLINVLKNNYHLIKVKSIFSHLAASESPDHDIFTKEQFYLFKNMYEKLTEGIGYHPLRHILNSGGIIRFPKNQMDMVRLGIGLYGIDESGLLQKQLQTVNTLKAAISQIKNIKKGETIGYGRMGKAKKNMRIATLSIGYADGLFRQAGNGKYSVLINGKKAPLVGNVCMDMIMADITYIPETKEGDEAIIFGKDENGNELPVQELAKCVGTIPYEIFTSISDRVKRVYVQE